MSEQINLFQDNEYVNKWEDEKDKEVVRGTLRNVYAKGYEEGKKEVVGKVLKGINELPSEISVEVAKKYMRGLIKQCQ